MTHVTKIKEEIKRGLNVGIFHNKWLKLQNKICSFFIIRQPKLYITKYEIKIMHSVK
jgi:hypothetical protein